MAGPLRGGLQLNAVLFQRRLEKIECRIEILSTYSLSSPLVVLSHRLVVLAVVSSSSRRPLVVVSRRPLVVLSSSSRRPLVVVSSSRQGAGGGLVRRITFRGELGRGPLFVPGILAAGEK